MNNSAKEMVGNVCKVAGANRGLGEANRLSAKRRGRSRFQLMEGSDDAAG
jgi:hypothetical protein